MAMCAMPVDNLSPFYYYCPIDFQPCGLTVKGLINSILCKQFKKKEKRKLMFCDFCNLLNVSICMMFCI